MLLINVITQLRLLVVATVMLAGGLFIGVPNNAYAQPLKIEVSPSTRQAVVGDTVNYSVVLRDARGALAPAAAPMTLSVTLSSAGGQQRSQLKVRAGASSVAASFVVTAPGPTTIGITHPQLISGGAVVIATTGGSSSSRATRGLRLERPAAATVHPTLPHATANGDSQPLSIQPPALGGAAPEDLPSLATPSNVPDAIGSAVDPIAIAPDINTANSNGPSITLYVVPDRPILADGQDFVDVVLNTDEPAPSDVSIILHVNRGKLQERNLVIPAGSLVASTKWISVRDSTGTGEISIVSATPRLRQGASVTRRFDPPIHAVSLTADPPKITLMERGGLLAELRDTVNDVPVPTDRDLKMNLFILDGSGDIAPRDVTFRQGEATARADFRPKTWGLTRISGKIPSRPEADPIEISVGFAFIAFAAALFGGTAGGALSWLTQRQRWWRIVIGTITGLILFFAFLFIGVDAFLGQVGELDILNPYSVFIISILGGWAGTAIFSSILKKIGIKA